MEGGGFSVVNADSHRDVLELMAEYPLFGLVTWDVRPLLEFKEGTETLRTKLAESARRCNAEHNRSDPPQPKPRCRAPRGGCGGSADTPYRCPRSPRPPESRAARCITSTPTRPNCSWPKTPAAALRIAADAWIDFASEPDVRQLVLLDAPSLLGWAGFREVSLRYGLGMTEQLLNAAIEAGELKPQPVRPLATIMIGALDEAAMSIANADDPESEKSEVRAVVNDLIDGLLGGPPPTDHRP